MITRSLGILGTAFLVLGVLGCGDDNASPDTTDPTDTGASAENTGGAQNTGGNDSAGDARNAAGGSGKGVTGGAGGGATGAKDAGSGTSGAGGNGAKDASSVGIADGSPPLATSGCGKPVEAAGSHPGSMTVANAKRTFSYEIPAGYSPGDPIALTLGFHGAGGNGAQAFSWGLQVAAAKLGQKGIFVFPDGVLQGNTIGWDEKKTGADVAFFDALVDWAEKTFCIDANRIFVVGFSWGNDFGNTLGCYRGDKIRAINGFSGGIYNSDCGAVTPAYRATYSTPDGTDAYSQAALDKAVNHYKTAQACAATTKPISPSPCLAYDGCAKPVIYCAYPNMGHTPPPNGGKDAWDFFASFK